MTAVPPDTCRTLPSTPISPRIPSMARFTYRVCSGFPLIAMAAAIPQEAETSS